MDPGRGRRPRAPDGEDWLTLRHWLSWIPPKQAPLRVLLGSQIYLQPDVRWITFTERAQWLRVASDEQWHARRRHIAARSWRREGNNDVII